MKLEELQQEVALWSRQNFGDQKGIEHLAPLMGLTEECGELVDAVLSEDDEETFDATGDIGIYSLDLCSRAGINATDVWPDGISDGEPISASNIVKLLGKVNHAFLKTHQGIRGYEDHGFAKTMQMKALKEFLQEIHACFPLTEATEQTWTKIVSKRNWTKPVA